MLQAGRTHVLFRGRKLSYFAGCDYFRLSSHPQVVRAVAAGLKKFGLNVAASRITTGNHRLYGELEGALAKFFRAPAALVVSTGYVTNAVVAQALRGEFSHVLIDAKAHVSLQDAARMFGSPMVTFRNLDPADLRRAVTRLGKKPRPILLTDGVFTYESRTAPVRDYLKILGPRGLILVDDAHGAGVVGKTGRGALEEAGVGRDRVIQTITLSKAFGVYGGAILCSRVLRQRMIDKSAIFAGSTPLPLPLAYAAIQSLQLLGKNKNFLRRLNDNVRYVKKALGAPLTPVPVIAITPANTAHAKSLKRSLLARGIYPSFIQYPGGPPGGYLRLVISSEHTKRQLDDLVAAAKRAPIRG